MLQRMKPVRSARLVRTASVVFATLLVTASAYGWGRQAHRLVNTTAAGIVPYPASAFFAGHHEVLARHSNDPDEWKAVDLDERRRHYMDIDKLEKPGSFDRIPVRWPDAVKRYGRERLLDAGTLPWRVEDLYRQLVQALRRGDDTRALELAAWLGHYVADATSPLHATRNYKGQLTGNLFVVEPEDAVHVHMRLEVGFVNHQFMRISPAVKSHGFVVSYVKDPAASILETLVSGHALVGTVIETDLELARRFDGFDGQFYDAFYARAGEMVEERLALAAQLTAALWYSAWVDATRREQIAETLPSQVLPEQR